VGHGAAQEPPLKRRKMKEATTVFEIKTDHPDSDDTDDKSEDPDYHPAGL